MDDIKYNLHIDSIKVVHNLVAVYPITYHPPRSPRYMECVRLIAYHCSVNVYQFVGKMNVDLDRLTPHMYNFKPLSMMST